MEMQFALLNNVVPDLPEAHNNTNMSLVRALFTTT